MWINDFPLFLLCKLKMSILQITDFDLVSLPYCKLLTVNPYCESETKKKKKTMTFIKTIEARRHVDEQEVWDVREVIL